jgi:hypothetical protein
MGEVVTLREAAALMRSRAEDAPPGPWVSESDGIFPGIWSEGVGLVGGSESWGANKHIASWHPAVALVVADWLTVTAWWLENEYPDDPDAPMDWTSSTGATAERVKAALTVARTYLGRSS